MDNVTTLVAAILALYLAHFLYKVVFGGRKGSPLPPGPKPLPFIGNVLDMPTIKPWVTFTNWRKQYGDVIYLNALGDHIIVLNSEQAMTDLLGKRAAIYSDRPRMPMLRELCHFDTLLSLMDYGTPWRKHRSTFQNHYNSSASNSYGEIQVHEAKKLIQALRSCPTDFRKYIQLFSNSTLLHIAYGLDIKGEDDRYAKAAEEIMGAFVEAGIPGRFLVDAFPILRYLPAWFPGAGFQKKAEEWRRMHRAMVYDPFNAAKDRTQRGIARPCAATNLFDAIAESDNPAEDEGIARYVLAVSYGAGSDTLTNSLTFLLYAMAAYPDVQREVHEELDRVVGNGREPEFSDRASLPYIEALVTELIRWTPPAPIGVPHSTTTDDVYKGMLIPKGSTILANAWCTLHDEERYPNPGSFRPERFLKDGKLNPEVPYPESAFGYGARKCPGRHVAVNTLFIAVAYLLWSFKIDPFSDSKKGTQARDVDVLPGILNYPASFECTIKPRVNALEN